VPYTRLGSVSWDILVRVGEVRWMASRRVGCPEVVSCPSGFHAESVTVDSLQMDYSALLAVAHYCGPFLLILKLDVD